eukprot:6464476-Pyramimonas_sp.AAC.1
MDFRWDRREPIDFRWIFGGFSMARQIHYPCVSSTSLFRCGFEPDWGKRRNWPAAGPAPTRGRVWVLRSGSTLPQKTQG